METRSGATRILVTEDSPTQAEQLKSILERHGYQVSVAENGVRALELLVAQKPDLVISDIMMPLMDGFELCRRVRAGSATADLPVILLTSLSDAGDVVEALSCGADSFVTKSSSQEFLLAHVAQVLAGAARARVTRAHGDGLEILFTGKPHIISADPRRTITMLISTYEAAVQRNAELAITKDELQSLNDRLEDLVAERTAALSTEIVERKFVEKQLRVHDTRLQLLLELHDLADAPQQEVLHFVKEAILKAVQSQFAFIGLLDDAEEAMTIHAWSEGAMAQCAVGKKPMHFSIATAGVWGECVRQRRSTIINDYAGLDQDKKKGYPAGHVSIARYLGIPVFDGNRIVAVVAAANKETDYTEGDAAALTSLANNAWEILRHRRDEEALKQSEEQLRQAQKMESIGTLAGGIAHDFNNILGVITGYGDMTRMKMSPEDPLRRYLDGILEATGRAANLTRSLLSFSRKQIMERRTEDLNQVMRRVEKFLTRVIGEDVALTTRLPPAEIPVFVDASQIEQVLMNLAMNSRDAMPRGGTMTVTAEEVALDAEAVTESGGGKSGAYAQITVTDTGVGMPEEVRRRIFEPFFTTKEEGKGTGLGLAVAYGIIKQHDGFITVRSEPGQGTTFRIFLPLVAGAAAQERPASRTVEYQGGTETILLAEDNDLLRAATLEALRSFGYTVIEAGDGEEAVRLFRENSGRVRLCLFDLMMPRKNGRDALEEIRRAAPEMRVLFTSGYAGETLRQKGLFAEGMPLIHKPASPAELLRKIREVLDQGAPEHDGKPTASPDREAKS